MNPYIFVTTFGIIALGVVLSISRCIAGTAEDLFARFENGNFIPLKMTNGSLVVSGWEMKSEDGKTYHRAILNRQVEELVQQGAKAVPTALSHLQHKHMHIRYIAAETLRRITKRDPTWYNFGTPGEAFNGNKTWSNDAIAEWKAWYESTQKEEAEQGVDGKPPKSSQPPR